MIHYDESVIFIKGENDMDFDKDKVYFGMEEFNGYLNGKCCDQCGGKIVFDGEQYECEDCGMVWIDEDDIGEYEPDEFVIQEEKKKQFLKTERLFFINGVNRYALERLFSPSEKFFKNYVFYYSGENDLENQYSNSLIEAVSDGASYEDLTNIRVSENLKSEIKEKIYNSFMEEYMSSIDYLPYNATPESWAEFLHITVEEVMPFFPKNGLNIDYYINPDYVIDNFSIIFADKIMKIDEHTYELCDDPFNVDYCFSSCLLDEEHANVFFMEQVLSNELKIARRYIEGYKTKKKEFLKKAKDKNLSVLETVMLFVEYAFEQQPYTNL